MIDEAGIERGIGTCQGKLLSEGKGRWEIHREAGQKRGEGWSENA
jgi:hypothetical protein